MTLNANLKDSWMIKDLTEDFHYLVSLFLLQQFIFSSSSNRLVTDRFQSRSYFRKREFLDEGLSHPETCSCRAQHNRRAYTRRWSSWGFKANIPYKCLMFFVSMVLQPFGPWPLFRFLHRRQSIGLLGRVISRSQGRYLHTEQHKKRINAHRHPCLE
jgi:hypothetical protein